MQGPRENTNACGLLLRSLQQATWVGMTENNAEGRDL